MKRAVGVDFGTTNSAIAVTGPDGAPELVRFPTRDGDTATFRSILYFERDPSGRGVRALAGPAAIEAYLDPQDEGRLAQSLKSFLASRLFSTTHVLGTSYRLEGLIAHILTALREAAEARVETLPERVVAGRPVRFANATDDADEALALARLEAAFHNAGFGEVVFEYEPVAAAYFYERDLDRDELILIADLGGGTTDFSLLRVGPSARDRRAESILGTAGVPIAGDSFDGTFVRRVVAPHLGMGTEYRSLFGRVLKVPDWIYSHVQRWNHLAFLKTPRTLQILFDLRREALDPGRLDALIHLVQRDLGFHLYRAVERTKVALSGGARADFEFADDPIRIAAAVERRAFDAWLAPDLEKIEACLDGLLARAGTPVAAVDRVFMTGGSSFVPAVRSLFRNRFGAERIRSGDELTSVATGLALRARELEAG